MTNTPDKPDAHEVELHFTRRYALVDRTCPACGATFKGTKNRRYCSDACQRRAAWQRNGPKANANRKKGKTEGNER